MTDHKKQLFEFLDFTLTIKVFIFHIFLYDNYMETY